MAEYLENVKTHIIDVLTTEPLTIKEISDRTNRPYTTIQQAHKLLREEGKIIPYDRKARGARWIAGTHQIGPANTVPVIQLRRERHKMTDFRGVNNIPGVAEEAAHAILKAWTVIATTASRINGAIPDDIWVKRLNRQKANLHEARTVFEELAFMCTQMLDNPNFWDVTSLDRFPLDKDWEEFEPYLKKMYEHYFNRMDD